MFQKLMILTPYLYPLLQMAKFDQINNDVTSYLNDSVAKFDKIKDKIKDEIWFHKMFIECLKL